MVMDEITFKEVMDACSGEPDDAPNAKEEARYRELETRRCNGARFALSSKVAYLLGVDEKYFRERSYAPDPGIFDELEKCKAAGIIRRLCIIRSAMLAEGLRAWKAMKADRSRTLAGFTEAAPPEAMEWLDAVGVRIYSNLKNPLEFLAMVNGMIRDRVNNCREVFPDWIRWEYMRDLFVMPEGSRQEKICSEAAAYRADMNRYPYRAYVNMGSKEDRNLLKDDRRFVTTVYKWHGDEFPDLSLVCGVGESTKDTIHSFVEGGRKTVFVVDCENSDPYSLCAAVNALDQDVLGKVEKIILYDDENAASAWEMLSDYINIPVEYVLIKRLNGKSLADVKVTARICKEYYTGAADSFVLVSSDTDYWGLIEEIPGARLLVMVEHGKFGESLRTALLEKGIFYCFIDNFYTGAGNSIKTDALTKEAARRLAEAPGVSLMSLMDGALAKTRIRMCAEDKEAFVRTHIKPRVEAYVDDECVVRLRYVPPKQK